MIPRLLAIRAARSTTLSASKNAHPLVSSLLLRTKLLSSFVARPLFTSEHRGQGHKTYFQPGDQPITSIPQYQLQHESSPSADLPVFHAQAEPTPRLHRVVRGLAWIGASWIIVTLLTVSLATLMKIGLLPLSDNYKLTILSSEHDKAASGVMELFSLLLLHIRNTGTLWDSYRDMELLEQVPLILANGTRATNENAAVVRMVDALGRTRFLLLAVDTIEPAPVFRRLGNSWVSESTPIQQWLLKLSNKIYTESNGEAVGLTLGYFTRDTMGFGPVGTDAVGGQVVMQCFPYDAEDAAGFGSLVDVLKDVKVEKEDLPELEEDESEENDAHDGIATTDEEQ